MNRGYVFGFLIVLLVVILGLYVAFSSFISSREALRAQSASSSSASVGQATRTPTRIPPTPTATAIFIPTPVPGITATLTALAPISGSEPALSAEPPAVSPTEPPPPAPTEPPPVQPTDTLAPPVAPPTSAPAPAYQFRLAGPPAPDPSYSNCCYLFGTIRDAAGNGLEGIQVKAFNEWNALPPAATKGGGEAGQYNIPIGRDVVSWYIVVVDAAGTQISPQVQIQFDPNVANGFRVDWQRTY
jgi:hypothetical protein